MKPFRLTSLAIAALGITLSGCAGPGEGPARASAAPARDAATQSAAAEGGGSQDSAQEDPAGPRPPPFTPFGVPECDRFVEKYVACVDLHVPADQRERMMRELHIHRGRWRELEKMQSGKVAVGLSCRGVAQRLKSDLIVDFGCEF